MRLSIAPLCLAAALFAVPSTSAAAAGTAACAEVTVGMTVGECEPDGTLLCIDRHFTVGGIPVGGTVCAP